MLEIWRYPCIAETMVWEVGFRFWLFGDFDDFLQLA